MKKKQKQKPPEGTNGDDTTPIGDVEGTEVPESDINHGPTKKHPTLPVDND